MVNCNPETVSTDYDTSDRLYFEPLTLEDVLEIVREEQPDGVIVQFGGQTPLKLARDLEAHGVPIIGTSPDQIDCAEDRERFQKLLHDWASAAGQRHRPQPGGGPAAGRGHRLSPWWCGPATCWAGGPWRSCYDERELAATCARRSRCPTTPVLLDRFLNDAIEVDVDARERRGRVVVAASWSTSSRRGSTRATRLCSRPIACGPDAPGEHPAPDRALARRSTCRGS
ncbi:MAG: hypothetical protein KatS3mg123_1193 [Burkholderiales bacterium]|nr:MAG: hypothetical protein KatS3mg123_1193 [Burkholderiales bacterium]